MCGMLTPTVDWLPMPAQLPPLFVLSSLRCFYFGFRGSSERALFSAACCYSLWNSFFLLEWHSELVCFDFLHACVIGKLLAARSANFLCPQLAELSLPRCYSSAHRWCDGF